MKRQTKKFIVAVVIGYAFAFWVLAARGVTTNDYSVTGAGIENLNVNIPGPYEWMSDSGWQSIVQLKTMFRNWSTNEHYLDGRHKTGFVSSAMIPAGAISRVHFESNVTQQILGSNGMSQLPLSDVWVQWVKSSNSVSTSSIFSLSWPLAFSNDCWAAFAGVMMNDSNYNNQYGGFSSNEYATVQILSTSKTNVWINLHLSGTWTTQYQHTVTAIGLGR